MVNVTSRRGRAGITLSAIALMLVMPCAALAQVRILQTCSRGGSVHVIDPTTQKVVGEIGGIPVNHGVAASADGSRIYVSSEAKTAVMVVDAESMAILSTIPVSARPHNVALTPDGRKLYVGTIAPPGAIDVIDTERLENVGTIRHPGGIHNVYVTPDGKHVVAGSIAGARLTVYDARTDAEVWSWEGNPIRPMAISTKPDGSTDKLYVQISYPELELLAAVRVGTDPDRLTFTPDGELAYVANAVSNTVTAIDTKTLEVVATIPVGEAPKRNTWIRLPPADPHAHD